VTTSANRLRVRRAPFPYFGGKYYMVPTILGLLPPHHAWVEAFCGSAVLTLSKEPAACEAINDIDEGITGFYRVLRDPASAAALQALLELTPYARAEYLDCRASWQDCTDPVERARRWFVVARQSFAGKFGWGGWSYSVHSRGASAMGASKWLGAIAGLPEVHKRLQTVQIECQDWRRLLAFWDRPEVLLYCDPPYVWSTRSGRRGYTHETTDDDHRELVERLLAWRGMALVSGYDHPIYTPLTNAGWNRMDVVTSAHSAGRTRASGLTGAGVARKHQARTETIWWNYDMAALYGQRTLFTVGVEEAQGGACARCGASMELTVEDMADLLSAVCAACGEE
jgi:DNA adenine methylase